MNEEVPQNKKYKDERELEYLLMASREIMKSQEFEKTARAIFDICVELIGATSGYVALLSDDGTENEVIFLESGGLPCSVDPSLPMPIRGLRGEAYHKGKTVYDNDFMKSEWMKYMPHGHVNLENVLFAPLIIDGKTVGLMGLANKQDGFNEDDARIASTFGEYAAIALNNSNMIEKIKKNEEKLNEKLESLELFKKLTIKRELKMVELKKEIDDLLIEKGEKPKYNQT